MIDLETELRGSLTDAANLITTSADPWADYRRRTASRGPHRGQRSVGLSVAAVVAATASIVVAAILLTPGGVSHRPSGVAGGQSFVLTPHRTLSARDLTRSAAIVQERLRDLGIRDATVAASGSDLQAIVPTGAASAIITATRSRGEFRVRQALSIGSAGSTGSETTFVATAGPAQSPTLTKAFLALYAEWVCVKHQSPIMDNDRATDYTIGCAADGSTKYLLAPAAVVNAQIASASAGRDSTTGTQWIINVGLDSAGSSSWQQVTDKAFSVNQGTPQITSCSPPAGCNTVAIVIDGVVQSAPYISQPGGIDNGRLQLSGSFDQTSARRVAAIIGNGPLPTTFSAATSTPSP